MGRPGCWFGYTSYLVCKPSKDIVEYAEFGCVVDGFVFFDETHANVLYGIA